MALRETNIKNVRKKRQFNYIQHLFKNNINTNVMIFKKEDLWSYDQEFQKEIKKNQSKNQ